MTSSTSEKQIKARDERDRRDRETDKDVIESLMSHPSGRRWVWLQLEHAQMFLGDENVDPYRMAFDKGRRNTGLKLLKSVQGYAPREYVTMVEENTRVRLTDAPPTEGEYDE